MPAYMHNVNAQFITVFPFHRPVSSLHILYHRHLRIKASSDVRHNIKKTLFLQFLLNISHMLPSLNTLMVSFLLILSTIEQNTIAVTAIHTRARAHIHRQTNFNDYVFYTKVEAHLPECKAKGYLIPRKCKTYFMWQ